MRNINSLKITSRDNPLIKLARELINSPKTRREQQLFLIEGLRLCADAAASGIQIRDLLYTADFASGHSEALSEIAASSANIYEIMPHTAEKISGTKSPQGIYCLCEAIKPGDVSRCFPKDSAVALEDIQDPGNLGSIARTAEALGFSGMILSAGCCDIYNPKALRASMGAFFRIPVYFPEDFTGYLSSAAIPVFACVPDPPAEDIRRTDFSRGGILLIGNEGSGLTESALSAAGHRVTIPMGHRAESLSAASAAAIAMWEARRGNNEPLLSADQ